MYVLFIFLAVITDSGYSISIHEVDKYTTHETCNTAKLQFEKDFTIAYPKDEDYAFACLKVTVTQ